MSDLKKFINAADILIELMSNFNDYDSSSHTEDTLEIHSEEITELWVKVKLSKSKYTNEDKVSKKLRSETEEDIDAVSIRSPYSTLSTFRE